MKKILITGKNSYVGTSVENWLNKSEGAYQINSIDMHGDQWKSHDFSQYDVILHVAGIAHQKETRKNRELYYKVNRDLAFETAKKAKKEGIKQFIFLSSMSVYGLNTGVITRETIEEPKTAYGKSKLEAEQLIAPLESKEFKIAILRPPMIYGPNSKGNYQKLVKFAKMSPIFPNCQNKRSMIYIENLNILIKNIIDNKLSGLYKPQNKEYVSTVEMITEIASLHGKRIYVTKIFNPLIYLFIRFSLISKVFGNLVYTYTKESLEEQKDFINFYESIKRTECSNEKNTYTV